jgi:hypothetical protein
MLKLKQARRNIRKVTRDTNDDDAPRAGIMLRPLLDHTFHHR